MKHPPIRKKNMITSMMPQGGRGRPTTQPDKVLGMVVYDGPRNLDSVLSYTWEQKGGGPSGEFKEEAHAVI